MQDEIYLYQGWRDRMDGVSESWREFAGTALEVVQVLNFVRLRHLLAAHLAYCRTLSTHTIHAYSNEKSGDNQ